MIERGVFDVLFVLGYAEHEYGAGFYCGAGGDVAGGEDGAACNGGV